MNLEGSPHGIIVNSNTHTASTETLFNIDWGEYVLK